MRPREAPGAQAWCTGAPRGCSALCGASLDDKPRGQRTPPGLAFEAQHTPSTPPASYNMNTSLMPPESSPALVLAYIRDHEPVCFIHDVGPFALDSALALLVFDLVALHRDGIVTHIAITSRGAALANVGCTDSEIVEACRELRRANLLGTVYA